MALAIVAGCLYLAVAVPLQPLARVQDLFTDSLFRHRSGSQNIALVLIGDGELRQHGRITSWPRSLHATAIENLQRAGARVIVYDMLFADQGSDDEKLASAIADSRNVVLASAGGTVAPSSGGPAITYNDVTIPLKSFSVGAAAVGSSNVYTDGDGRVRRIPLLAGDADRNVYQALSLAAFDVLFHQPQTVAPNGSSLQLIGRTVPLERDLTMRVNFVGGKQSFAQVSFESVLTGDFDASLVKDKVVFVGIDAAGVDRHSAPLLGNAAGVEVQANALDTLLRARFLRMEPAWVVLLTGLLLATIAGLAIARVGTGYAVVLVGLVCLAYVLIALVSFSSGRILDVIDPAGALAAATLVGLVYRVFGERTAQREIVELFGRHVSKEVASELVRQADRGELHLGGEVRDVTVLFADIRGFTTLSEAMDPAQLVQLINDRYEVIVDCVVRHGGIVNKFVGDAVMAFWNAPREQDDHAYHACMAAMDALDRLDAMPAMNPQIRFGFGVNSGSSLAGNVGSAGRFEYTIMGETVNTASRLSGVAGGGEIWVGERTVARLAGRAGVEPLPPQQLKGMSAPINVYRLLRRRPSDRTTVPAADNAQP